MPQNRRTGSVKTLRLKHTGDPAFKQTLETALTAAGPQDRWTHHFHTWPAGLHPDAAAALIPLIPAGAVLDPFMGGGTVLIEAMASGRAAYGRDISPIAIKVARTRTALVREEMLTRFRGEARRISDYAKRNTRPPDRGFQLLEEWYQPHVLCELEGLRQGVANADDSIRGLLEACFSSILVKTSYRQSDTVNKRIPNHRPRGSTAILFHKKARELGRRLEDFGNAVPPGTPFADIQYGEATTIEGVRSVAGILTSPPYPGIYDYLPLQQLRNVWLGQPKNDRLEREIGSRRSFREDVREGIKSWHFATNAWMRAAADVVEPGGRLIIVIGNGFVNRRPMETLEPTLRAAERTSFQLLARSTARRPDHLGGTREEHIFVFEQPESDGDPK